MKHCSLSEAQRLFFSNLCFFAKNSSMFSQLWALTTNARLSPGFKQVIRVRIWWRRCGDRQGSEVKGVSLQSALLGSQTDFSLRQLTDGNKNPAETKKKSVLHFLCHKTLGENHSVVKHKKNTQGSPSVHQHTHCISTHTKKVFSTSAGITMETPSFSKRVELKEWLESKQSKKRTDQQNT